MDSQVLVKNLSYALPVVGQTILSLLWLWLYSLSLRFNFSDYFATHLL